MPLPFNKDHISKTNLTMRELYPLSTRHKSIIYSFLLSIQNFNITQQTATGEIEGKVVEK